MSQINVDIVAPQSGVIIDVNGVIIKQYTSVNPLADPNSDCVALGEGALEADLVSNSSWGSTAVGFRACYSNMNGQYNTGIGNGALVSNQLGYMNTAVGAISLSAVNGGQRNVGLGMSAGNNITTGDNNICIGHTSTAPTATTSNSITLGNSSHTVIRAAVTTITSLSDARDKKDVKELGAGLDFVKDLKPVEFVWDDRDEDGKHDVKDFGFIAQDLKKSQEDAGLAETLKLVYEENPEKLEASYGKLVPILVKAIQELTAKVEALEAK